MVMITIKATMKKYQEMIIDTIQGMTTDIEENRIMNLVSQTMVT
jgi:hypothetical protein